MDDKMCRLCLKQGPTVTIFCDSTVVGNLQIFCDIHVNYYDNLPKFICKVCFEYLNKIIEFKHEIERNDKFLHSTLVMNENDNKCDIDINYEDVIKCEASSDDELLSKININKSKGDLLDEIKIKEEYKVEKLDSDHIINKSTSFQCELCGKLCANRGSFTTHILSHEKSIERCDFCNKTFKNNKMLKSHIRQNHTPEELCNYCGKIIRPGYIKYHKISENNNTKQYECTYCKINLTSKACFSGHLKLHKSNVKSDEYQKNELTDNCAICGLNIKVKLYDKHLRTHTPSPFECDYCSRKFKYKCLLQAHIRSHTLTVSLQCYVCGKLKPNKNSLRKHINYHLSSDLTCKLCGKTIKKSSMKFHMYAHTGDKKFECDICKQKFITKQCIETHIIIHSGSKPFKCRFCKSKFANKKTHKDHEMLHTGERPHKCPECNKEFIQLANMKSHFRNNHKGVEFFYKSKSRLKREGMLN